MVNKQFIISYLWCFVEFKIIKNYLLSVICSRPDVLQYLYFEREDAYPMVL